MNSKKRVSRREFLRLGALTAAGAALASCCPPEPTGKEVIVTKIVEGEEVVVTVVSEPEPPAGPVEMTDVGTPRNETLIFQTFDRQTADPDNHNPMMAYARWRGFRELCWGALWETDTGTGVSYPELAAEMPEVLNDEHTKFRVVLKEGIYWSDGVEFTADDCIYTLDTYHKYKDQATRVATVVNYWTQANFRFERA